MKKKLSIIIALLALLMMAPVAFAGGWNNNYNDYSIVTSGGASQYANTCVTGYGSFYQDQILYQSTEIGSVNHYGLRPIAFVDSVQESFMTQNVHGGAIQTATDSYSGYNIAVNHGRVAVGSSTGASAGVAVYGNGSGSAFSVADQFVFVRP